MADDKPYRPKPLAGRNPKLPIQLSEKAAAARSGWADRHPPPTHAEGRAARARSLGLAGPRSQPAPGSLLAGARPQRQRKTGRLSQGSRTQVAHGESAAQAGASSTRKLGRLMIKAGTKNVTLPIKKARAARQRHSLSEERVATQKSYPRREYGAAKRFGKGPSQLKKALRRMRSQTAGKLPVVGTLMGVSGYKAGGGPSASQLLKGKAKNRQKKYTSGPKGHMKTLDYAGIHPGSI